MRKAKHFMILMLALFVGMGFSFGGNVESASAAVPTPVKTNLVSAKANGQNTITIKWYWAKNATNYAVYRDGKCVQRTSTGARSFVQKGLKPGTKYGFQVRAYRTYKQKQWYNKKTKKWQASMPAKSVRGKTRTVTAIKYGPYSVKRYATTAKPAPVSKTVTINGEKNTLTVGKASKLKVYQVSGVPTEAGYLNVVPKKISSGSGYCTIEGTSNGLDLYYTHKTWGLTGYSLWHPTFNKNNAKYKLEKYGLNYWEARVYDPNVKIVWTLDGTEPKLGQADKVIDGKDYPFLTGKNYPFDYLIDNEMYNNPVETIKVRGTASVGNPCDIFPESEATSVGMAIWIKVYNGSSLVQEGYECIAPTEYY